MATQTEKNRAEALERAVTLLMEHFDAVQIVGTYVTQVSDGDKYTHYDELGAGNFYARRGAVEKFLECRQNEELAVRIARNIKESN